METSNYRDYKIEFHHRPEYFAAFVSGKKNSVEISKQFWHHIAEEFKKNRYEKLLVVEEVENAVSLAEMFEVASKIPQLFPGIRIAVVDKYAERQKLNEFCEIVATNRGARKKVFATVEAAEDWLLS